MFDTLTASSIISTATTFSAEIIGPLLIVIGFGVAIFLANWVAAKFRR
jgi:hypothetical protein